MTLTYIYADSTAVLGPLATFSEPHSYDLCEVHGGDIVYDWRDGYLKSSWHKTTVKEGMIVKSISKQPVKLEFKYKKLMTDDLYYIQSNRIIAEVNG